MVTKKIIFAATAALTTAALTIASAPPSAMAAAPQPPTPDTQEGGVRPQAKHEEEGPEATRAGGAEPPTAAAQTTARRAPTSYQRDQSAAQPRIHHAPLTVTQADEVLHIDAHVDHPELVRRTLLVFRGPGQGSYREAPFKRGPRGPYVASIASAEVRPPWLEYTIEIQRLDGRREAVFASRSAPHRVLVPKDGMEAIEEALEMRLDGRRNEVISNAEYVSFGRSRAQAVGAAGAVTDKLVDDRYFRIEGGYTYRPLGVVSAFSIRAGVIRGSAPVAFRTLVPGQAEDERFDVGLNYGATTVQFRLAESWHLDASFLANVTEVGFSVGTGAGLHIGDPFGSKLSLGFEAIQTFGVRFFSQVDILAHERLTISPIIEVTNMPSANDFGVRLLTQVRGKIGWGFSAAARGGYQARDFTSGGPSGGGSLGYAF